MLLLGDAPPNRVRVVPVLYHVPSLSCKRETPPIFPTLSAMPKPPTVSSETPSFFWGFVSQSYGRLVARPSLL
jgi:hypothetical protein